MRVRMKKTFLFLPFLLIISGFIYNHIIDEKMKQLLQQLNVSDSYAQEMIFSGCSGNYFNPPNLKAIKGLASGDRTSLVPIVGKYIKDFTSSQDFIKRYNNYRETKKPKEPEKPKTIAQMKDEQCKGIKEGIANLEQTKKQTPKDQQGIYDDMIQQYKEQLKTIDDPDNPMFSPEMEKIFNDSYQQQMTEYNAKLSEWKKEYPADNPKPMIRTWVNTFLEKTADVNYNAKTATGQYGKDIFVDQKYERKDGVWKMGYRAGKAPMDAARSFAQGWLSELK